MDEKDPNKTPQQPVDNSVKPENDNRAAQAFGFPEKPKPVYSDFEKQRKLNQQRAIDAAIKHHENFGSKVKSGEMTQEEAADKSQYLDDAYHFGEKAKHNNSEAYAGVPQFDIEKIFDALDNNEKFDRRARYIGAPENQEEILEWEDKFSSDGGSLGKLNSDNELRAANKKLNPDDITKDSMDALTAAVIKSAINDYIDANKSGASDREKEQIKSQIFNYGQAMGLTKDSLDYVWDLAIKNNKKLDFE